MTIEQVIAEVEVRVGQRVTPGTELQDIGLDSLEFLDLLVALGIPDAKSQDVNTVYELYLAAQ